MAHSFAPRFRAAWASAMACVGATLRRGLPEEVPHAWLATGLVLAALVSAAASWHDPLAFLRQPNLHANYEVIKAPEGRAAVQDVVAKGITHLKIWLGDRNGTYPAMPREVYEAVIDEAMRLYPPIISISRAALEADEIAGQPIKRFDLLRGRMVVNLFFEASTRTRTSFEIAAKRLGCDAVSITAQASSVSKGESLVDTLNTLGAMRPDAIIMRHAASGARLAAIGLLDRHLMAWPFDILAHQLALQFDDQHATDSACFQTGLEGSDLGRVLNRIPEREHARRPAAVTGLERAQRAAELVGLAHVEHGSTLGDEVGGGRSVDLGDLRLGGGQEVTERGHDERLPARSGFGTGPAAHPPVGQAVPQSRGRVSPSGPSTSASA